MFSMQTRNIATLDIWGQTVDVLHNVVVSLCGVGVLLIQWYIWNKIII